MRTKETMERIRPIEDYKPSSDYEVLHYPFDRPQYSFITNGDSVEQLPDGLSDFIAASNAILQPLGLPLMDQRIPVVAYGANSNPHRLMQKMSAYGDATTQAERLIVPNALAEIPNAAVVWHGKPGRSGSTFAELYTGDDVAGENTLCHVSFLTPIQLALMHTTEGVTYHLTRIDAHIGPDSFAAYAYLAGRSHILLWDGLPVRVRRAGEVAPPNAMTAEEAVNYMVGATGQNLGAKELVDSMRHMDLSDKIERQAAIQTQLARLGISRAFSWPHGDGYYGRAHLEFNHGHIVRMAEQVAEPLRPKDKSLRNQSSVDIAHILRQRAHDELAIRLEPSS